MLKTLNFLNIIYFPIVVKKKNVKKKKKFVISNIVWGLAKVFQIFFNKPRANVTYSQKYKQHSLLVYLWGVCNPGGRVYISNCKFIEFIYNFYRQFVNFIY